MPLFDRFFKARPVRRPRVAARVPIEERAEMHRAKDGSAQSVILVDLSHGGARISTPLKLTRDEALTLIINAGRHQPFEVGCRVVVVRPRHGRLHYDYGLKFVAVKPGEIQRLRTFVAKHDDARKSGLTVRSHRI